MKKIFTLIFVALFAMYGLKAQATMYLVGEGFNGWSTTGNVEMTDDGEGIYSWSGTLTAGSSFAFFRDTEDWGSQRGPVAGDGSAPTGDWEATKSGGAWKLTTSGSYVIQYNYNTDEAKIALAEEVVFNPAQRRFAVTGEAFGGWNMPPSGSQIFANNGDGTYTLEYNGASASEFKLSSIDINSDFTTNWSVFDSGVMGASNLSEGDNSLLSSYGTANMQFPVSGNVTLTISNVTETGCTLTISLIEEIVPDKAFYLIGSFNEWNDTTKIQFVNNDSVFTITKEMEANAEFKIKDENGNWIGGAAEGNFIVTQEQVEEGTELTLLVGGGNNFQIPVAGTWTLTINPETMKMVISGEWNEPAPEHVYVYILGEVNDQSWAPNVGLQMDENGDTENYYTAEFTLDGRNDGYNYFGFTTKLADTDGEEGWDFIAPYRFGAVSEGDFLVTDETFEISLTDENGQAIKAPAGKYQLTLDREAMMLYIIKYESTDYAAGDVNGDDKVDVSDVNAAINIILELKTADDYLGNADLDNSGVVDISDVNAIINIILEN